MTVDEVSKKFSEIIDFNRKNDYPESANDTFGRIMEHREKAKL